MRRGGEGKIMRKKMWELNKILGYCSICGEPIEELKWIGHPEVTVEHWTCKHNNTITLIKKDI